MAMTACVLAPGGGVASATDGNTIRLWGAESGRQIGFRVIQVSAEAWRDLGWLVPDDTGALTRCGGVRSTAGDGSRTRSRRPQRDGLTA
jgi:hypothetical protein